MVGRPVDHTLFCHTKDERFKGLVARLCSCDARNFNE